MDCSIFFISFNPKVYSSLRSIKTLANQSVLDTAKLQNSSNDAFEYYRWTFCPMEE